MNQNIISKPNDDIEVCGPRPPVLPGKESRKSKMTERSGGYRDSPPSYFKWARTLKNLLDDGEGVELFKKYVESEGGIHADRLKFYFACEGLKHQPDPEKAQQMIHVIYRAFKLQMPEDIKKLIRTSIKNKLYISPKIYDQMQQDTVKIIDETTYRNFLQSDLYLQHVQNMRAGFGDAAAPDCSGSTSSSSGSASATDFIKRSSTLPTLHEDSELVCDHLSNIHLGGSRTPEVPVKLTEENILASQKNRLEVRPPGAHGYSYTASAYSSYNPVSLQDSERQSLSSGRDSDTYDGVPYNRRPSSIENRKVFTVNRETEKHMVIPRTLRPENTKQLNPSELYQALLPKLEKLKREQETNELFARKLQESDIMTNSIDNRQMGPSQSSLRNNLKKDKNLADAFRILGQDDDNDQAILDQHVSRVWSDLTPSRSPGTMSPYQANTNRRRPTDPGFVDMRYSEGASSSGSHYSMKHSKSMPEHRSSSAKKLLSNKWPSMNTDSGISVLSTKVKSKEPSREFIPKPRSGTLPDSTITTFQLEEASRRLEDENRRSKRYAQQQYSLQSSTSTTAPLPKQQQPLPPTPSSQDFTIVVFNFCDEEFPYRIKIPGLQPTLKQFKEFLPKKGNFRYFFKTICEELDSSVIQEEVVGDMDLLPFIDGKVKGVVKPAE